MKKRKQLYQVLACILCIVLLLVGGHIERTAYIEIEDDPIALEESFGTLIKEMDVDITVIPDKYNTGCKGNLTKVDLGALVNGIQFKAGNNSTTNVLDFGYGNKSVTGVVTFENYDFSDYPVASYNEAKAGRNIKVVFNNCEFSKVSVGKEASYLSFEFNDCTIQSFNGSNAVFNNCQFGKSCSDGLVPFQNIEVNDSFFCDMGSMAASGGEIHTDGTQIYGIAGLDVQNITYNNCRFEIPPLKKEGSTATINACIMLQMEYSNAKDILVKDCILNGGGYSIYAWCKSAGYSLNNIEFDGIRIGGAKAFGTFYPRIDSSVKMNDFCETDALYISSVWKENGETHFSVSNDTNQERTLLVITDKGNFQYTIPACPKGSEMTFDMTYDTMPFDLDIVVPKDCQYAVCYDNTLEGYAQQIRFVNWGGQTVRLEQNVIDELFAKGDDVLYKGSCGNAIEYTLTKEGVLTLKGEGRTYDYHSAKLPPWSDYSNYIKALKVEEGVEYLGNQLFRGCTALVDVKLPNSLVSIGTRTFASCTSLTSVTLTENIRSLGNDVFANTILQEVCYEGNDWGSVVIGSGNEVLTEKVVYVSTESVQKPISKVIMQGSCGKQAEFILTEDGVLRISGCGATYNYHSAKVAPWYEMRELIKTVIVEEGIEKVGEQLFRNCHNLEKVELPDSLIVIGKNAFISCMRLNYIVIPRSLKEIQTRAFAGISYVTVAYEGTATEWNQIDIGSYNDSLLKK